MVSGLSECLGGEPDLDLVTEDERKGRVTVLWGETQAVVQARSNRPRTRLAFAINYLPNKSYSRFLEKEQ